MFSLIGKIRRGKKIKKVDMRRRGLGQQEVSYEELCGLDMNQ